VSTGLAGALRNGFRPGDILVSRLVSEAGEPVAVASHRELLSTAVECGAKQIERFATSRTVVASVKEKKHLGNEAEAVEMESYTILAEAARHGVPSVAIRAISDTVDFNIPYNFESATNAYGQIRLGAVLAQVLRRPSGFPALLTLARDCRTASRHLADFLDIFAGTLADRLIPIESDAMAAL
jgi:adenosylhomocysteine nucleosidase